MQRQLYDMDQVLLDDGRIVRVMGSFNGRDTFYGFNLYSPQPQGDRSFRGQPYIKNYFEEQDHINDALEAYELFPTNKIVEFHDPIITAQEHNDTFADTIWHTLYEGLVNLFGDEAVGILGSALSGLHLRDDGTIRNDVDFFIEGLKKVPILESRMWEVREALGFKDYGEVALQDIYRESKRVFKNPNVTIDKIISRRWSGMELPGEKPVRNTIRFRDKQYVMPLELLSDKAVIRPNTVISGVVKDAVRSNLYPRMFTVVCEDESYEVTCMWWKFSSPVRDEDIITICGDLLEIGGKLILRVSNFQNHYLKLLNDKIPFLVE